MTEANYEAGNVNTLDVLFPATPFFLYANPEMIKYALRPIFEFQEANFYPNGWAMHDLGSSFPNAIGHVRGDDEAMPVEESGNLVLMSYAYYKFSGNVRVPSRLPRLSRRGLVIRAYKRACEPSG